MSEIPRLCNELAEKIPQVSNESYIRGYNDGYEEGLGDFDAVYIEGYGDGYAHGEINGIELGKKEEHDAFWDAFQSAKTNFWAKYAGTGWTTETFRPTNDLNIVNGNASYCFGYSKCRVDLVEWCRGLGININIKPTVVTGLFQSSEYTRVPVIDTSLADSVSSVFAYCSYLVTIDKLILKNDGTQTFSNTFYDCKVLRDITIEGVIGRELKIQWSPLLSKASITSIMEHLSTTATFSISLSKTAVNKAFETAEGANDGSNSAEWQAVIDAKPANVTVSLI